VIISGAAWAQAGRARDQAGAVAQVRRAAQWVATAGPAEAPARAGPVAGAAQVAPEEPPAGAGRVAEVDSPAAQRAPGAGQVG
jgi:hypothetical protein